MAKNKSKKPRKVWQTERLMSASLNGDIKTKLTLFNGEVKYWVKNGFFINTNNFKVVNESLELYEYVISFDHSYLLNSDEIYRYIMGESELPKDLSFGQELYLFAQRQKQKNKKST